jgi:hypothetical protein
MYHRFGSSIYSSYGFRDAFNASFRNSAEAQARRPADAGWVDPDYLGIDQGPILAMIENYRSELVWRIMRDSTYLRTGLERAGFSGGWLAQKLSDTESAAMAPGAPTQFPTPVVQSSLAQTALAQNSPTQNH